MKRKIAVFVLLAALCTAAVTEAFAATPEFGRTEEEWSRIRDNTLEFDEIDALINEYNPTVKSNAYDLREFKNKYGKTNEEISEKYRDLASELEGGVDLDTDNPMYAMNAMSAVSNQVTARQLEQQADNAVEDYEVNRLGYEQQEKQIAQQAKQDMIAYYYNQLEARRAQLNVELLENQLKIKKSQTQAGTATQVDVLKATEELMNAQKAHTQAAASIVTAGKKLQVACGWKYDDTPVIAALPAPDMAGIAAMNPDTDAQKAIENNYTLKMNQRKLSNARSDATRETLQTSINSNMQNIPLSVTTAYMTVTAARDAYDYAVSADKVQKQTLAQMRKKHETGDASDFELKAEEINAQISQIAIEQAKYSLLEAITLYNYAVGGLAGA